MNKPQIRMCDHCGRDRKTSVPDYKPFYCTDCMGTPGEHAVARTHTERVLHVVGGGSAAKDTVEQSGVFVEIED